MEQCRKPSRHYQCSPDIALTTESHSLFLNEIDFPQQVKAKLQELISKDLCTNNYFVVLSFV